MKRIIFLMLLVFSSLFARQSLPADKQWHKVTMEPSDITVIQNIGSEINNGMIMMKVLDEDISPSTDEDGFIMFRRELKEIDSNRFVYVKSPYSSYQIELEVTPKINVTPIKSIVADSGKREQINSIFGEGITGTVNVAFSSLFCYQGDTRKLQAITSGGAIGYEDGMLKLSSGTSTTSSAIASSKRSLPYKALKEGFAGFTARFTPVANNKQYIGIIDNLNGFAVGMNGLEFSVFHKRDSVFERIVKQSDFNLDKLDGTGKSKLIFDPTKLNIFRISYGYLGIAPATFEIHIGASWVPFHRMEFANIDNKPHLNLPYLKFRAYSVNEGNTTNVSMYSGSIAVGTIGNPDDSYVSSRDFTVKALKTVPANTLTTVIVFHIKETYGIVPIENRVETILSSLSIAVDGTKNVSFERYKLAISPTGGTWTDVSANSVMEINTTSTVDLTGAELTFGTALAKVADKDFNVKYRNLRGLPGDYIAYVFFSTGAVDVDLITSWEELF